MVVGLFTMGLGALLFVVAAGVASYPLVLTALMILAAGIIAVQQVAANLLRGGARPCGDSVAA